MTRQSHMELSFPFKRQRQEIFLLVAIFLLAAFLRLDRLDRVPPGLHYDEAFNATQAQKVLAGVERPIYFREDLTEEPMAIYIAALSFALFGPSPWALRLVSALAGIVTVAALYALAREMFQSKFTAALAAFTLAILYWHVNFSRLGMEPIFTPLMMTLAFMFLWRALYDPPPRSGGGKGWGLAGIFLGLTQYTYKAALFVPLLVGVVIAAETLADKTFWPRHRRGLVIFALAAFLVFAPLGLYFAAHPSEFIERPATVTRPTSGLTIVDNAIKIAGMFFLRGDDNPRSNLPGRPALDPFLAIGFIAGIVVCIVQIRRAKARWMLAWLAVMVLPSALTDFAPHFGRSLGATPAIALIVAEGFAQVANPAISARVLRVGQLLPRPMRRLLPALLLIAGLASSAYSTYHDYFDVWGAGTGLFDSFDVGLLSLAQKLHSRPGNESIYLSPVDHNHYTVQFGLGGAEARSFDGRRVLVLPEPGAMAAYGIITRDDTRSLGRLGKIFPRGRVGETIQDFTFQPYAAIFRAEDAPQIAPQKSVGARLDETITLIGYDVARDGNVIALTVYWGSIAETRGDYTVFAHVIDASSRVWAQDDAQPGRGSYPTSRWRAGEVVIDDYRLVIPAGAPRGERSEYQIEIGMYILETGARVRMIDANGARMENDRVLVERFSLP